MREAGAGGGKGALPLALPLPLPYGNASVGAGYKGLVQCPSCSEGGDVALLARGEPHWGDTRPELRVVTVRKRPRADWGSLSAEVTRWVNSTSTVKHTYQHEQIKPLKCLHLVDSS